MGWDRYQANRQAKQRRDMHMFAGLIAEGMTITAAARHMGMGQQNGSRLFALIRAELGWQAQ